MDADNSGKLDADEVAKLCKQMGKKLNQKGLQAAMADMDADGSGEVSAPRLCCARSLRRSGLTRTAARCCLRLWLLHMPGGL